MVSRAAPKVHFASHFPSVDDRQIARGRSNVSWEFLKGFAVPSSVWLFLAGNAALAVRVIGESGFDPGGGAFHEGEGICCSGNNSPPSSCQYPPHKVSVFRVPAELSSSDGRKDNWSIYGVDVARRVRLERDSL